MTDLAHLVRVPVAVVACPKLHLGRVPPTARYPAGAPPATLHAAVFVYGNTLAMSPGYDQRKKGAWEGGGVLFRPLLA